MSAGFFRKSALEKLSTPEKLDQLIKVTNRQGWIALLTVTIALGTALAWSIFGKVKTKLDVVGVIQGGEVHQVVSTAQGQLIELRVSVGDKVFEGEITAILRQPQLQRQIEAAKAVLSNRNYEMKKIRSYGYEGSEIQEKFIAQTRESIEGEIAAQKKRLNFLQNQLKSEKSLLAKGLITNSQVARTDQQIETSKNTVKRLIGQMTETRKQKHNVNFNFQQKITLQKQRISEAERNLEFLREQYDNRKNIRSPYDGEVVEVLIERGGVVGSGTPLFRVQSENNATPSKLTAVLYIPSKDGKKIKNGMNALISPSTVQPQEYGFIKGEITYVSEFPVTQQGMLTSVNNALLAKGLLAMGPLFEVHVNLKKDHDAFSGFKWTSANGPDVHIKEGTSCLGKITVKEERPITLVVPAFKKFFDLY